jgi:hypothetical protein
VTSSFSDPELQRARLAGRLEAESDQLVRNEHRDAMLKRAATATAVIGAAFVIWSPWNSAQRQAQAASDSYYQASGTFTDCTPRRPTTTWIVGCWDAYRSALGAIAWPASLSAQASAVETDATSVIGALRTGLGYDQALVRWRNDRDSLESALTQLSSSH